jgi:dolichol-phosphate mannosyltransferase
LAGAERIVKTLPRGNKEPLRLLTIVIPCRNEEGAIASTAEHLCVELRLHGIEHEIVTVDPWQH